VYFAVRPSREFIEGQDFCIRYYGMDFASSETNNNALLDHRHGDAFVNEAP